MRDRSTPEHLLLLLLSVVLPLPLQRSLTSGSPESITVLNQLVRPHHVLTVTLFTSLYSNCTYFSELNTKTHKIKTRFNPLG